MWIRVKSCLFIAILAVIVFGMAACSDGGEPFSPPPPQTFTSITDCVIWLVTQRTNTPATAYIINLNINDSDFVADYSTEINNNYDNLARKYFYLDLSGSAITTIPAFAFWGAETLTGITIPNSVTSIGDYAFYGCTSLASVTIPNSVTSIGRGAFSACTSLTEIKVAVDNTAYTAENGVLYNKDKTTLLQYPAGKTGASFTIPTGVTSIGQSAFYNCASLKSITIPGSVTSISGSAFYNCASLTSVTIPDSVTSIGDQAFCGCTSLTSVTIPNSVTSIGEYAFGACFSLTGIIIPNSVTSIGHSAFSNCWNLTSITIPNSVTSIGGGAFFDCTSLTEIKVAADNTAYTAENGVLYNKDKTTLLQYPAGKTGASFTIPTGVTSIGQSAFYNCASLKSITIPNSVTSIGGWAFCGCTSLTSVTIPNSVTSIGDGAFEDCSSLASITIPNSVTSIGYDAFAYCHKLTSVTFSTGSAITSVNFGSNAFPQGKDDSGDNLKTAYLAGGTGTYTRASGGSTWTRK